MNYKYAIKLKDGRWIRCTGKCYCNYDGNKKKWL